MNSNNIIVLDTISEDITIFILRNNCLFINFEVDEITYIDLQNLEECFFNYLGGYERKYLHRIQKILLNYNRGSQFIIDDIVDTLETNFELLGIVIDVKCNRYKLNHQGELERIL